MQPYQTDKSPILYVGLIFFDNIKLQRRIDVNIHPRMVLIIK